METSFLLYGANGYTGELIARHASWYGLKPVLAGRRKDAIAPLAEKLGLSYLVVDLNNTAALESALADHKLALHAAGPFQHTAKQMVDACLRTRTHYIDINGDIAVFEMLKKYDAAAKGSGIMIMPGVGFDVVPTDCLALSLKQKLPDATDLKIAFITLGGSVSHGTATTMASKLGEGGAARVNGKIVRVPLGKHGMWIDFGEQKYFVMSIPWGDVSTAHFTTGIPNIETFVGIKPSVYRALKLQPLFNWLLRTSFVRSYIKGRINKRPAGPGDEARSKAKSLIWGQVTNDRGEKVVERLSCADGYTLTMHASLLISRKILQGNYKSGYQTPAAAYGEGLVFEVPGTTSIHHI
ncbi:MAG TPA: saccharopine dehydrogenase NADP-binding domain-containing protein [Chitinophagaceae bacterium]|nr:saccharopine dehydrogenase NADP-binding domain-containing protein [Chitinophagaceae bacterium]